MGALNAWLEQSSLLPFLEAEIFSEELRKENPYLRAEVSQVVLSHVSVVYSGYDTIAGHDS